METSQYLDAVMENPALFVESARRAGLDAPVPTCPNWNVGGLATHQGRVFRWAGALVATGSQEFIHPKTLGELEEGEDPIFWLVTGAEHLLSVLEGANPEA